MPARPGQIRLHLTGSGRPDLDEDQAAGLLTCRTGRGSWLAVMVLIAGQVAARRACGLHRARPVATAAVAAGAAATVGALLALGVISPEPRVVIPVGGMVVSGAMIAAAVTLTRLRDEAAAARPAIEARLCLGMPATQAFAPHLHIALRTALIPAIDSTKTVGLISLPGAMTGLILAGVSPLTAIRYQIVVKPGEGSAAVFAAPGLEAFADSDRGDYQGDERVEPPPAE